MKKTSSFEDTDTDQESTCSSSRTASHKYDTQNHFFLLYSICTSNCFSKTCSLCITLKHEKQVHTNVHQAAWQDLLISQGVTQTRLFYHFSGQLFQLHKAELI